MYEISLFFFFLTFSSQIFWESRWEFSGSETISYSMDLTCFKFPKLKEDKNLFWCLKCHHYIRKYLICVSLDNTKIVKILGGFPGGIMDPDCSNFALIPQLRPGEKILCDKIFRNRAENYLTPYFGQYDDLIPPHQIWNNYHEKVHWEKIEQINGQLSKWEILDNMQRNDSIFYHKCAIVCTKLLNFELEFWPLDQ